MCTWPNVSSSSNKRRRNSKRLERTAGTHSWGKFWMKDTRRPKKNPKPSTASRAWRKSQGSGAKVGYYMHEPHTQHKGVGKTPKPLSRRDPGTHPCCCCSAPKSCSTLCHPMEYSPSGSSFHGFSRQEHAAGRHFPFQGIFPTQGLNCVCCIGKRILDR